MKNKNYSAYKAEMYIKGRIEALLRRFIECKSNENGIKQIKEKIQGLDTSNADFIEVQNSFRENNKMLWCLLILILGIGVDFFLLFHGLSIICEVTGMTQFIKYFLPAVLVILECGVSYFSSMQYRYHDRNESKISKWVPYLVLIINIALSVLTIVFAFLGHNEGGTTLLEMFAYAIGVSITQFILLIASTLLHIWLIRNSDLIAEMVAYYRFTSTRRKLEKERNKKEVHMLKYEIPGFTNEIRKVSELVECYQSDFPNYPVAFVLSIPRDLVNTINKIMGRNIFNCSDGDIENS